MTEYTYSCEGSDYDDFQSTMENLQTLHDEGEKVVICRAECVRAKHSEFIDAERLIDEMVNSACDEYSYEWCDGYLEDVKKEKMLELDEILIAWFKKNADDPTFFLAHNPKNIAVVVGDFNEPTPTDSVMEN